MAGIPGGMPCDKILSSAGNITKTSISLPRNFSPVMAVTRWTPARRPAAR